MANFWDSIFGSAIAANFVLASPNGAAGPLTPRALVFADLPAIPTGTILWSQLGNAAADLTLANSTFNTTFNQTSAAEWLWANTTVATSGTTNTSPILKLSANYWTGAASAADVWSLQSSLAAGTNGASTLTLVHTGSSGTITLSTAANVSAASFATTSNAAFFSVNQAGTGMSRAGSTQSISFSVLSNESVRIGGAATPYGVNLLQGGGLYFSSGAFASIDAGISRLGAASLAIGNGTAGDFTGALKLTTLTLPTGGAITDAGNLTISGSTLTINGTPLLIQRAGVNQARIESNVFRLVSTSVFGWSSGDPNGAGTDAGLSRLGAASVALGNGTAGSFTGSLKLTTITLQGKVDTYNAIATVSNGIPAEYATVDLTAQTADIGATTMYAVPAAGVGMYRVSVYIVVSQAATTSSTLPKVQIKWTDNDNNTVQTSDVTVTNSGNALTTFEAGVQVLNAKASTNIQYVTTGTATSGATPLNYALHLKLEAM